MFEYKTQIRLHHTDAAGLLFFANQLVLAHDAYETLLSQIGLSYEKHLIKGVYLVPIVHIESDYKKPLFVGDKITIHLRVSKIGTTSFTLNYQFYNQRGVLVGNVKTIHVTMDKKTKKKISLPKAFRSALEKISD